MPFSFTSLKKRDNGFKHYYITLTNQFRHTVKEYQVLLINANNSIQHYSFVKFLQAS